MSVLSRALEPNNLRLLFDGRGVASDVVHALREDASFARTLSRTLVDARSRAKSPTVARAIFPDPLPLEVPVLRGKRVGVVASGGSGALASLCGVRRALEEAGVEVTTISACSGAMLFASLWALGMNSEEMARFWLSLRTSDYVDPDWAALARAPLRRFRGWTGLLRGEAIERTFRERFGDRTLGDLEIPLSAPVWNIDQNRLETIGTKETPELTLARAVRVAISIPIFVEPVRIDDRLYGDGGIVNVFPTAPLVDGAVDVAIGINCYFPERFEGEDVTGWEDAPWSILRASAQLRSCVHLALAREEARRLGPRLVLLHPVPYTEIRGAKFYETFLDRTQWPRFMKKGYDCARSTLERLADERSADTKKLSNALRGPPVVRGVG